jgi:hypothetical protein
MIVSKFQSIAEILPAFRNNYGLILLLVSLLIISNCTPENPVEVHIEEGFPPRFLLSDSRLVRSLFVYHIPAELANKSIPVEQMKKDDPNIMWMIEGHPYQNVPINYGVVPDGMIEVIKAKPLSEGEHYLVFGTANAHGGMVGARFVIHNGRAYEFTSHP